MSDQFTEVTSQSWFSRLGGAFKGILFGLLLIVGGIVLIFWNEGRAVETARTLEEGAGAVVSLADARPDPANEGKLVHVTGPAKAGGELEDAEFGVKAAALRLRRLVEMYQWRESSHSEKKKKLGGGEETKTTYTYKKEWADTLISSGGFKKPEGHQNPGTMPFEKVDLFSSDATLGQFRLPRSLISRIDQSVKAPVDPTTLPAGLSARGKAIDGIYYRGKDPAQPAIGDLRVSFRATLPTEISVIAAQIKDTFGPYAAKAGGSIELLREGTHAAAAMFQAAQTENSQLTWILRAVGFILLFIGFSLVLRPLSVLVDIVPFLGNLMEVGVGIVAFLLAAPLALVTVAIAWLVARPLLGIGLLVAAAGLVILLRMRWKQKSAGSAGLAA
jgi:hypothetical protein